MTRAAFPPPLAIALAASAAQAHVQTPPGGNVMGGCGSTISGGGAETVHRRRVRPVGPANKRAATPRV
jgi:hypothetical protein